MAYIKVKPACYLLFFLRGIFHPKYKQEEVKMKGAPKAFVAVFLLLLPCLYYQPSELVSLGYQMIRVVEISYGSLLVEFSKVWG